MKHESEAAFREGEPPIRPGLPIAKEPGLSLLSWLPRPLAVLLLLGGCFWGLLLSPWVFRPDVSSTTIAVFGPGYVVTFGYFIRALLTPSLLARRLIWAASLLVQGSWLAHYTWAMAERVFNGQSLNEPPWLLAWWVFATAASAFGLFAERE